MTIDELVGVLMALMATIGVPRVSSAGPKISLALGYDIESALERHQTPRMAAPARLA